MVFLSFSLPSLSRLEHERVENEETGTVTTSLPEDVFSLVNVQVGLLHQYLVMKRAVGTNEGDSILIEGLLDIVRSLYLRQSAHRNDFLSDLESTCAAANDFYRMMEALDELMESLRDRYPHLSLWDTDYKKARHRTAVQDLAKEGAELLSLLGNDAVFAVRHTYTFVLRQIRQSALEKDLFSREWEEDRHNSIVISLVKTVEDYLYDCYSYLSNEFLYRKIVASLMRGLVCFYIRTLLRKADDLRRTIRPLKRRWKEFKDPIHALVRMMYDIEVLQGYLGNLAKQLPSLQRLVEQELGVLVVMHELMSMAAGDTNVSTLEEFVVVLHKRTGADAAVTKQLLLDLWLLAAPRSRRHQINDTLALMNGELQLISSHLKEQPGKVSAFAASTVTSTTETEKALHLEGVLKDLYRDRILHERHSICGVCVQGIKSITPKKQEVEKIQEHLQSITGLRFSMSSQSSASSSSSVGPGATAGSSSSVEFTKKLHSRTSTRLINDLPGGMASHVSTVSDLRNRLLGVMKLHNIAFVKKQSQDIEARVYDLMNR